MGKCGVAAPEKKRVVIKVKFNGIERRYRPTRHYVYILQVRWSDYSEYVIYRKYSAFHTLQCALLEKFPIEAGCIRESDRVIPHLPKRSIFSGSGGPNVANQRGDDLGEYSKALLELDPKISTCSEVIDFFEVNPEDINPPNDVTKKPERSRLITALLPFLKRYKETAEVDKELNISDPITLETYVAIADYTAEDNSEVSLKEGVNVEVFEKNCYGWWFVQMEEKQGWAPASYLSPVSHPLELDEPDPTYSGDLEEYITTERYDAAMSDEISFEKEVIVEVMHKLLDGWWIISYHGEAGYAPAAFLTPYQNPHLVRTITMKNRTLKLTPRRCTLTNATGMKKNSSRRDLSIYRKYSKKRNASKGKFTEAPSPSTSFANAGEIGSTSFHQNETVETTGSANDRLKIIAGEKPQYSEVEHYQLNKTTIDARVTPSSSGLISQLSADLRQDEQSGQVYRNCPTYQHTLQPDDLDIDTQGMDVCNNNISKLVMESSECDSIPDADLIFPAYQAGSEPFVIVNTAEVCDIGGNTNCLKPSAGRHSASGAVTAGTSSSMPTLAIDDEIMRIVSSTRL